MWMWAGTISGRRWRRWSSPSASEGACDGARRCQSASEGACLKHTYLSEATRSIDSTKDSIYIMILGYENTLFDQ